MSGRTLHGGPKRAAVIPLNVIDGPAPKPRTAVWVALGVFVGFICGYLAGVS